MYSTNLWYQFDLSRYKIAVAAFLIFLIPFFAKAQKGQESGNMPTYDDKWMHYGFSLGLNSTVFNVKHSDFFLSDTTVNSIVPKSKYGFSLGFVVNLRLADHFDLRLLPGVSFYERTIKFGLNGVSEPYEPTLEQTFIELPLLVKFKSTRRKNLRMYMISGIKPSIEVGAKRNQLKITELRTRPFDFVVDLGAGFDIYYELFKWSPEIRMSFGLLNLLNKDPNVYSRSIDRMSTFTVTLFSHFE